GARRGSGPQIRSPGLQSLPTTVPDPGSPAHGRHAHTRLSKVLPWKLPMRPGLTCRTCVHSPWMHGVSGLKSVTKPNGAPTWPPWVASSTGGLVSSTTPPPVTRQPPTTQGVQTSSSWVSIDFGPPFGSLRSTDPSMVHVAVARLQASLSTAGSMVAVKCWHCPCGKLKLAGALVASVSGVPPTAGHSVSLKRLSVTWQLLRSAVPLLHTSIVTPFVLFEPHAAHVFCT